MNWAQEQNSQPTCCCTVHLVDPGIDTGDILLFTPLDVSRASSIAGLRQIVDRAQIKALGQVVQRVVSTGLLPPRRVQTVPEGRQYFSMHEAIREILSRHLVH